MHDAALAALGLARLALPAAARPARALRRDRARAARGRLRGRERDRSPQGGRARARRRRRRDRRARDRRGQHADLRADGTIEADNTDAPGPARRAARAAAGRTALVLGAGGSARAAAWALREAGAAEVAVLNRTPARAEALAADLGVRAVGGRARGRPSSTAPRSACDDADATPVDLAAARSGAVVDLVYRDGGTALVRAARERGPPDGRRPRDPRPAGRAVVRALDGPRGPARRHAGRRAQRSVTRTFRSPSIASARSPRSSSSSSSPTSSRRQPCSVRTSGSARPRAAPATIACRSARAATQLVGQLGLERAGAHERLAERDERRVARRRAGPGARPRRGIGSRSRPRRDRLEDVLAAPAQVAVVEAADLLERARARRACAWRSRPARRRAGRSAPGGPARAAGLLAPLDELARDGARAGVEPS